MTTHGGLVISMVFKLKEKSTKVKRERKSKKCTMRNIA